VPLSSNDVIVTGVIFFGWSAAMDDTDEHPGTVMRNIGCEDRRRAGPAKRRRSTAYRRCSTIGVLLVDVKVTMSKFFAALILAMVSMSGVLASESHRPPGPAMMVHFDYYPRDLQRVHALERRLDDAMERARVGRMGEAELHADGNDGYLYMYGEDSDRLYAVVKPILMASKLMSTAEVTKHYGADERTFALHQDGRK
jgi:hypothetical protein